MRCAENKSLARLYNTNNVIKAEHSRCIMEWVSLTLQEFDPLLILTDRILTWEVKKRPHLSHTEETPDLM